MKKVLKISGLIVLFVFAVTLIAFLFRTDPWGIIAGKRLSGPEVSWPADWSSCQNSKTIAIETMVDDPYSVTTWCFVHENNLYIPSADGEGRQWTQNIIKDPRVRIKIGDSVYLAKRFQKLQPKKFTVKFSWKEVS